METSSSTVARGSGVLFKNDPDGMEFTECEHFFVDAGEDELNEHQKKSYRNKLTDISEFWKSLQTCNLSIPNQKSTDVQETGTPQPFVAHNVPVASQPSSTSTTVPSIPHTASSSNNVLFLDQNTLRMVSSGEMKLVMTPNSTNAVASPIMSPQEIIRSAEPATHNLPISPPPPPNIRLKPQSRTSSLFNSIPVAPAPIPASPLKAPSRSPHLETLLSVSRELLPSKVRVLGNVPPEVPKMQPTPFPEVLAVPQPVNVPPPAFASSSGVSSGQNHHLNGMMTQPPSVDLPLLPPTRDETTKPLRTFLGAKKSTTPKQSRTPAIISETSNNLVDLTDDDNLPLSTMPQNEVQQDFVRNDQKKGPMREKTFPSLVVTVRPSLKAFPQLVINNERLLMDNQIRKVMQMAPSIFTEYLLQKRLLRTEQTCKAHGKNLKLGMYSEPGKFPHSGGYVWIAECCSSGFSSVFSGSIFDKTLQAPTVVVKLMYHWACNTAVHNVLNWVKVDNFVLKTYYTFFRAVCTSSVHEKLPLLGGPQQKVQVGVISVGTTAQAGDKKEVKVDILAVMDSKTQNVRLRALENFFAWPSNKVYESKFVRILEVLQCWVHPQSIIITDFAVDMALCHQYGFSNIHINGGVTSAHNNTAVVSYLRAKIPTMFQNTLSLLSFQIIQQFLDELVWREVWGPIPSRAYESLVSHTAEMTKLPGPDLILKLKKIASNPFKNWKHAVWTDSQKENAPKSYHGPDNARKEAVRVARKEVEKETRKEVEKQTRKEVEKQSRIEVKQEPRLEVQKPMGPPEPAVNIPQPGARSRSPVEDRFIVLESYYYGYICGNPRLQKKTGTFLAECALCKRDFLSATSFTNHLIHHSLNSLEDLSILQPDQLLTTCRRCFNPVRNLDAHMENKHPEPPPGTAKYCEICKLNQGSHEKLFKHMTYMHCELDVPYECDLCHFRTSMYKDAATHFKNFHDKDTCLQCPYCLKIIRFCCKNGQEITRNQVYFVQHIQKHSNPKLNRKCEKCVLSFVNMGTLKDHQERYHSSAVSLSEIVRYQTRRPTMMPTPVVAPYPPVTLHESSFHTLNGKALSSSIKVNPQISEYCCAECDSSINQSHFSVKMSCTKCSFHSNCANAMREHAARVHLQPDLTKRSQMLGGNPLLEKIVYCSACSFHSNNGNRMANHLSRCNYAQGIKPVATPEKRKFHALHAQSGGPSRKMKNLRQVYIPGSLEDPPDF